MYCKIGHKIVIAGALFKGSVEIREMLSMGLWNYLHTTVSNFLGNLLNLIDL
jgi:hypothetical protein